MKTMSNDHPNQKIESLREQVLASIEGDDPFRREKVVEVLNATSVRQLEDFLEEVTA
jgi:hypothetical protein